jgi:putative two-component system response regulator
MKEGLYKDQIDEWDVDTLLTSAPLHDVGKIAISDLVLNKPGKLDNDEMNIMKTHVNEGVKAIERIMTHTEKHSFLQNAYVVTKTHHEKWDGTGYPEGLKGEKIPLKGRLMAIADVYDALISVRPYKKALSHEEACQIMESNSGSQFDPALVEVFKKIEPEFKQIAAV